MVAWGKEHFPNVDGEKETAKFIDHFLSATGSNATKLNWPATWRNWIRRAEKDYPQGGLAARTNGHPGPRSSTTDQRVGAALDLAAYYRERGE